VKLIAVTRPSASSTPTSRAPLASMIDTRASSASRQTARSPCGCGTNRLPPTVARLRIDGDAIDSIAECRNSISRPTCASVVAAPMRTVSPSRVIPARPA
jgi:hypothetical protein